MRTPPKTRPKWVPVTRPATTKKPQKPNLVCGLQTTGHKGSPGDHSPEGQARSLSRTSQKGIGFLACEAANTTKRETKNDKDKKQPERPCRLASENKDQRVQGESQKHLGPRMAPRKTPETEGRTAKKRRATKRAAGGQTKEKRKTNKTCGEVWCPVSLICLS